MRRAELLRKGAVAWPTVIALLWLASATPAQQRPIPRAFGPHVGLDKNAFADASSYRGGDKIVGTYYFYWYDAPSKAHIVDHDGSDALTTHPASMDDFSWNSVTWHRRQLEDMMAAGIDVVLPVYWGAPSEHPPGARMHWSLEGLVKLVEAREAMLRDGRQPPRIGMFYDTSTLQHNSWNQHIDLTTDYGRQWFYATVRDFFSIVPPRHWAMIDDKPLVVLYSAAFARAHDQGLVEHVREAFARDFAGRVPYLVPEISWKLKADSVVAWGGALGLRRHGVAALGPGYDHSAVPGREPLIVQREGGRFYERNWRRFLRDPVPIVLLETWNEFHEGTDICESREYGRKYIELTRRYVDAFKQGQVPERVGPYAKADSVSITLDEPLAERGLSLIDVADGRSRSVTIGGRTGREAVPIKDQGTYLYFAVDDNFKFGRTMEASVVVEYLDREAGRLTLEYDGSNARAPLDGAYTGSTQAVALAGRKTWNSARFRLPEARLINRQNGGADFRLVVPPTVVVRQVTLERDAAK